MTLVVAVVVLFSSYCLGRATAGRCPLGWTKTCSGTCIKYFSTEENLSSAEFYCTNRTGGRLVTLETKEKITFFKGFLVEEEKLGTKIWLGAHKSYGQWRWGGYYTGQFSVTDWYPGEPNDYGGNKNCVETYENGKWRDQECSHQNPYICELRTY